MTTNRTTTIMKCVERSGMSPNFLSNKVILEGHDDVALVYSSGAIRENLNAKLKVLLL